MFIKILKLPEMESQETTPSVNEEELSGGAIHDKSKDKKRAYRQMTLE